LISKIQTNGGHLAFTKWEFVNIIMPSTYGTGVLNYYGVITLQVPNSRNARQKLLKLTTTSLQTMFFFLNAFMHPSKLLPQQ
jgi:hypothetical protein